MPTASGATKAISSASGGVCGGAMNAPLAPSASTAASHAASTTTSGAGARPVEGCREVEDKVADMAFS